MNLTRWTVFAALILGVVIGVIFGPHSLGMLESGHARAVESRAQLPSPSAARDAAKDASFDYFPSHYANQAKEPAEPIASF